MGNALGTATPPPPQTPWQELVDGYNKTMQPLREQLTSPRSLALYETLGAHFADATTGGVVFWLGISSAQLLQHAMRVGAATPMVPSVIGTVAVASSSVLALHFASLPRELVEDFQNRKIKKASSATLTKELVTKLRMRVEDLANAPLAVYAAMGLLSFTMLGGRVSSLAPSHYANLGAFHLRKASLPATEDYAGTSGRVVIQEFGRLYGCHTCGVKRGVQYHADHMPPKLVAKRMNESLWRRISGRQVPFRFYPQCQPCSNVQGHDVKMGLNQRKLHLSALRLYHSAGFWLVLLCTGGLYVGGSSFHETADVHQQSTPVDDAKAQQKDSGFSTMTSASSSDHALLVSLRERERKLKKQRRGCGDDAALVAVVDAELRSIEECKQRLKDTMKRTQRQS